MLLQGFLAPQTKLKKLWKTFALDRKISFYKKID